MVAEVGVNSLLKIENSPVLAQFLHDCVNDLTEQKQINFDNYNSDIEWTFDDFNGARKYIQKYYRESITLENFGLDTSKFHGNLRTELANCMAIRKDDIFEALVKNSLRSNGTKLVENIDWRLKWVLGSSHFANIREPVLQVDLHCTKKGNDNEIGMESVNFEMDLDKLNDFIEQLEQACKEVNK